MFFKNYQLMFLTVLFLSTTAAVSANSWFTCWLSLEINLMSMIPLMLIKMNSNYSESAIKYFLTQAMASVMMIFSVVLFFNFEENLNLEFTETITLASLVMKAGLSPFHFWFPQVSNFLNWQQCMILFTWQKIAPLILITSFSLSLIIAVSVASTITGAIGGFNQKISKLLLTYSSISHGGWMLVACTMNFNYWLFYFFIYTLLSLSIMNFLYLTNTEKVSNMLTSNDSIINKAVFTLNMLSLGGIPPLLGFTAKLLIIMLATKMSMTLILVPMIIGSVISLFFYTRLIYSNLMNVKTSFFMSNPNFTKFNYLLLMATLTLNILSPVILVI